MADSPAPDPVAAYLAGARARFSNTNYAITTESPRMLSVAVASTSDVPPLLAAVEAVLDKHKPEGYTWSIKTCGKHDALSDADPVLLAAAQQSCPDCRKTEHVTCGRRSCGTGPWPCPTYQAISAALLGEPTAEFKEQVAVLMDANDGLLRRLAEGEAPDAP